MNPPIRPTQPFITEYNAKVERKYIYRFVQSLKVDYEDDENDEYKKIFLLKENPKDINLKWLLDNIPAGIKPENIKIDFGFNFNTMSYEDHYIGFYYEQKIPARQKEYKAAMKQFEIDLEQYNKDMEKYKEYQRLEEIKQVELKLEQLKSKGNKNV